MALVRVCVLDADAACLLGRERILEQHAEVRALRVAIAALLSEEAATGADAEAAELERAAGEKFQMIPLGVSRSGVSVVTA